jgi:hypothetical protein
MREMIYNKSNLWRRSKERRGSGIGQRVLPEFFIDALLRVAKLSASGNNNFPKF